MSASSDEIIPKYIFVERARHVLWEPRANPIKCQAGTGMSFSAGSSREFPDEQGKLFQLKANSGKSDLFLIFPFFVSVALMRFHNMPSFSRLCLFYIVQPFSRKQECMCLILIFNVIHSVLSSHRINLFLTFSRKIKTISKFKCCKVKKLYDNSSANMHWQWRQVDLTQTSRQISGNTRNKVVEREEFFSCLCSLLLRSLGQPI